jgi:hypothetical protein
MSAPQLLELPPNVTHFYRYQTTKRLDWLKPVILEHRVYIPTAKELNDPRECKPRFAKLTHAEIRRFLMESHRERNPTASLDELATARGEIDWLLSVSSPQEELEHMAKILYSRTENMRVFSMSKRCNNMSMWWKYADAHRGYCLEFAKVGLFVAAHPVLYDDSYALDLRQHREDVTFAWTHCKSPDWSGEEEIRVVLPSFTEPVCPIGHEALTRILLGERMAENDRRQILAWAAERNRPLTVANVRFDSFTQELQLLPVDVFGTLGISV